jgi:hypothetical protein
MNTPNDPVEKLWQLYKEDRPNAERLSDDFLRYVADVSYWTGHYDCERTIKTQYHLRTKKPKTTKVDAVKAMVELGKLNHTAIAKKLGFSYRHFVRLLRAWENGDQL